jgi:hypothetical protein
MRRQKHTEQTSAGPGPLSGESDGADLGVRDAVPAGGVRDAVATGPRSPREMMRDVREAKREAVSEAREAARETARHAREAARETARHARESER